MTQERRDEALPELAQEVLRRLSPEMTEVLERAASSQQSLYLVGGSVRDALLPVYAGKSQLGQSRGVARDPILQNPEFRNPVARDLDLLTEGDAQHLGETLQEVFGGDLTCHAEFMTCTLSLPELTVDIATAREEVYPFPGSLPNVEKSTLEKDLLRRDFTLNALAVRTGQSPVLIDLFGGLEDLQRKQLRTLHAASFTDDPTRILRGARLAGRLGFTFHPNTAKELVAALEVGAAHTVSATRLKNELLLTLAEPQVTPALNLMAHYNILRAMFGLRANHDLMMRLDERRRANNVAEDVPDETYLLALLMNVPEDALAEHAARFGWSKHLLVKRRVILEVVLEVRQLDERALDPSVRVVLGSLNPDFEKRLRHLAQLAKRRKLRGQDVLDLGLPSGPEVGNVLAEVARARADGRADSFQAELDLAKALVEQRLADF